MSDLKPCPFCGGKAKLAKTIDVDLLGDVVDCHYAICTSTGCGNLTQYSMTPGKAIAAWNRRPEWCGPVNEKGADPE